MEECAAPWRTAAMATPAQRLWARDLGDNTTLLFWGAADSSLRPRPSPPGPPAIGYKLTGPAIVSVKPSTVFNVPAAPTRTPDPAPADPPPVVHTALLGRSHRRFKRPPSEHAHIGARIPSTPRGLAHRQRWHAEATTPPRIRVTLGPVNGCAYHWRNVNTCPQTSSP